jgi:hypothetical protein
MHNQQNFKAVTFNHVNAGLVAGTTSTYTTTATTVCSIKGKFATGLTAQTNTASPTTDANTSAAFTALQPNECCALVWGVNESGAIKLMQGPIVPTYPGVTTTVGAFRDLPQFPVPPDDVCPIAYMIVRTAPSAAAWTAGTSSWTASGVSVTTAKNVATLPDRPQSA